MKCSYTYNREYLDEIESDIFEDQSPVGKIMTEMMDTKERTFKIATRPSKLAKNTPNTPNITQEQTKNRTSTAIPSQCSEH